MNLLSTDFQQNVRNENKIYLNILIDIYLNLNMQVFIIYIQKLIIINIVPIKTSFKCNIKILKTEQPIISGNFSFSFVTVKLKKRVC